MSVPLVRKTIGAAAAALFLLALVPSTIAAVPAATPRTGCPAVSGMKPLIRGLVDRHVVPPATDLQASAIDVPWSALENSGPGLAPGNLIDQAIALSGCTTPLRLRILAGISAPDWVKLDSGGAVSVINPFDNRTGKTIGRFWTDAFKQRYDNLQSELAAAYDSVPNLYEVVVSRCSMFYPEPFLRGTSKKENVTNLLNAGYTVALDKQCQQDEIDSTFSRWTTVRVGVSFNPYQLINPDGTVGVDEAYTEQMMGYCRNTYGPRCVLENDSIRDPISGPNGLPPEYSQMYSAMSTIGAPLAFQTAVNPRYGDFWGTLLWARQHHAASVELPVDGDYPPTGSTAPWQTLAEVAQWFQEDPALTATPLSAVEGSSTSTMTLATLALDERAAVDTIGGYGDVGSVPFDTVSALVVWPDGASEAALLTTGQGGAAASVTCSQQLCSVTILSGGHTPAEEAPTSPAAVTVSLGYVPADGISLDASPAVSVSDAALALVKMQVQRTNTPKKMKATIVFFDADPAGLSSDYTVTISWGDTSSSVVVATAVTGGFSAITTHAYPSARKYRVDVGVLDSGGAALTAHVWIKVR